MKQRPDVTDKDQDKFTKMICLSLVNDEIPEVNKRDWLELIEETVTEGPLSFPCSTRPPNPVGGPMIVAFSDGSFQAYSAVVYLRW